MADRAVPERTGHLKVPEATLYYEVRGEGPLLLMMPGGSGFLEHVLCSFSGYVPDPAALRRGAGQLVIGVGQDSRTLLTALPGARLADEVGGRLVEFAGGHTGCTEDPDAFAERLRAVLLDRTLQGALG